MTNQVEISKMELQEKYNRSNAITCKIIDLQREKERLSKEIDELEYALISRPVISFIGPR